MRKILLIAVLLLLIPATLAAQEAPIATYDANPTGLTASVVPALLQEPAGSDPVLLRWDANPSPGLAGYRLYWGKSSRTYDGMITVPLTDLEDPANPEYGVRLVNGTWYFAVTAYNLAGLESDYSNEPSGTVDKPDSQYPGITVTVTVTINP